MPSQRGPQPRTPPPAAAGQRCGTAENGACVCVDPEVGVNLEVVASMVDCEMGLSILR